MEVKPQDPNYPIDLLRKQMQTERKVPDSPLQPILHSNRSVPSLHLRSSTQSIKKVASLSRDLSHRLDSPAKIPSSFDYHEAKLREILGIKRKSHKLPSSLSEIQSSTAHIKQKDTKKSVMRDLESIKKKFTLHKDKLLKKIIQEGGLLFRTQSGLIQPQLTNIYEQILTRKKKSMANSKAELDLGVPSGRKEVEIIIAWLETMVNTYVDQPKDLSIEEKVQRAQLIYTACYQEVIRQVSSHCIERGVLMQRIWNAQIDINNTKEDNWLKEIESIQKKFDVAIANGVSKYKNKCGELEKMCKYLKENLKMRESETNLLKNKVEEMKLQADKDRTLYLSEFSMKTKKSEPKVDRKIIRKRSVEESSVSDVIPRVPVVMVGYFDADGSFYKTRVIQNINSVQIANNYPNDIVNFIESEEKECQAEYTETEFDEKKSIGIQVAVETKLKTSLEYEFTANRRKNSTANKFLENFIIGRQSMYNYSLRDLGDTVFSQRHSTGQKVSVDFNEKSGEFLKIFKGKSSKSARVSLNNSFADISRQNSLIQKSLMHSEAPLSDAVDTSQEISHEKFRIIENKIVSSSGESFNVKPEKNKSKDKDKDKKPSNSNIKQKSKKRTSKQLENNESKPKLKEKTVNKVEESELTTTKRKLSSISMHKPNQRHSEIAISPHSSSSSSVSNSRALNTYIKSRKSMALPEIKKHSTQPKQHRLDASLQKSDSNLLSPQNILPLIKQKKPTKSKYSKAKSSSSSDSQPSETKDAPQEQLKVPTIPKLKQQKPPIAKQELKTLTQKQSLSSKLKKNSKPQPKLEELHNESCQVDINPVLYSDISSPQVHSTMHHLRKLLKDISTDPERKVELLKDTNSLNKASELSQLIQKLISEELANGKDSVDQKIFDTKFCQTEDYETEKPLISVKLNIPHSSTVDVEKRYKKKAAKTFKAIRGSGPGKSQLLQPESQLNSQSTSRLVKSSVLTKPAKIVIPDEFTLGQILRKLIITHPGQRFMHLLVNALRNNPESRVEISIKSLMKVINSVYQEKLSLCRENSNYSKYDAPMIIYDLLMNRYGLKIVAENKLKQIVVAGLYYQENYIRIKNFVRFISVEPNGYQVDEWNFYLNCMDIIDMSNIGKNIFNEDTAVEHFSTLPRINQCIYSVFESKLPQSEIEAIELMVQKLKIEENQSSSKRVSAQKIIESVNTDMFIDIMLKYYLEIKEKVYVKYFKDYDKDDIMNEEEFGNAIRNIKAVDNETLGRMFERYCVNKKINDDKVEKVIKVRGILSMFFDYAPIDLKELYKKN